MSLTSEALSAVGLWLTRQERQQDRDDAALRSVLTAVDATKLYLASLDRGESIDRTVEASLVDLWTTASVHIRRTDADLAVRLRDKADYWTNPENWTDDDDGENGIHIGRIAKDAERLIAGS